VCSTKAALKSRKRRGLLQSTRARSCQCTPRNSKTPSQSKSPSTTTTPKANQSTRASPHGLESTHPKAPSLEKHLNHLRSAILATYRISRANEQSPMCSVARFACLRTCVPPTRSSACPVVAEKKRCRRTRCVSIDDGLHVLCMSIFDPF